MNIQKLGYKKDSPFKNRKSIKINSNNITMKDVEFPILAVPDGDLPKIMYPNQDYLFPNSKSVMEYKMKKGGVHPFESYLRGLNEKDQDSLIDYLDTLSNEDQQEYMQELMSGGCVDCDEMKKGGWIQKAIKHPGRCSNPGDSRCPKGSPQYNLAMRFKHGDLKKHQEGGNVYPETSRSDANVEVEGGETALLPNGSLVKFEGAKHSEGGIPTSLPGNTFVFSEHLKVPKELVKIFTGKDTKKEVSYADISKRFDTSKWEKILKNPNSDPYSVNTAELKIATSQAALNTLFGTQELIKDKDSKNKMQSGGYVQNGNPLDRLQNFGNQTNGNFPVYLNRSWSASDKQKSFDPFVESLGFSTNNPGFAGQTEDHSFPIIHQEPSPTVTTGVVLHNPYSEDDVRKANLFVKSAQDTPAAIPNKSAVPSKPTTTSKGKSAKTATIPLPQRKPFPNFDFLTNDISDDSVVSERGAPTLPSSTTTSLTNSETPENTSVKRNKQFGLSPKLTGTILDVLLAQSDTLKVQEPWYYDQRKYPIMSRFVDIDNKEAEKALSLAIRQVQNSDMPEQVKQSRIADLNAQYQNARANLDLSNTERYAQKVSGDLNKLEAYSNANIDQHRNDIEDYLQRKSRVDYLRDQFRAQKKSRTVNSLRQFFDYVEDTNMKNQLSDNYNVNPWTGRIDFKGSKQDPLKAQEEMINQYQQNSPSRSLPNGASLTMIGPGIGIVTSSDGKSEIVKFN